MPNLKIFTEDMESCKRCSNLLCPCKKLVQYLEDSTSPEEALKVLQKLQADEETMEAYYYYLDKIDPLID